MKKDQYLSINEILLEENQFERYLEKIASEHILQKKSDQRTYPIKRLEKNFNKITKVYELLMYDLKIGINIHPAGEWLLDNYYVIEEIYKTIKSEMTLKKYKNLPGLQNGKYKGFARIYVLATEIVSYTEGQINEEKLCKILKTYQHKKILNMDEIWNISTFIYISLIEQIKNICEKIYFVQVQKYKVESIIERLIENKKNEELVYKRNIKNIRLPFSKEPFIEYLSYRLNQYGKKGIRYSKILEEQVEKTGTTVAEIIKKEHFDIALKKILIGNAIKSIKDVQRINFTDIFETTSKVEEILKKDPAKIYNKMTHKTKEYYRNRIKEIASKNKLSELYIVSTCLELANSNKDNINEKRIHIGYYIIDEGINLLYNKLNIKNKKRHLGKYYIFIYIILTSIISLIASYSFFTTTKNLWITLVFLLFSYIPISEIILKIIQYIFSKIIKPKFIPKIDLSSGIPKEYSTIVIVPTILKDKETVKEMLEKLEIYYLANESENIYFTLLGDCTASSREKEENDKEIIQEGINQIERLNQKYQKNIFEFIYRKRIWNSKENKFLGWERKRGLIYEFNEFLLGNTKNTFIYNSLISKEIPEIKYVITIDSDTNLSLESAKELIGSMAHILNKPIIDREKNIVVSGYGMLQPRIGIDLESSRKTLFTKIFAGLGGTDFYSNAISDIYQDNFGEGSFTGKGIYDLKVFNKVLKNVIPENTVLSHDLLEGIYARCGLVTDITLLDAFPSNFNSYITRNTRWIRGDWQIINWLRKKVKDNKNESIYNPINELGKFKIIDNLRRSLLEICQVICILIILFKSNILSMKILIFSSIFIDLIIDILNMIIFKKYEIKKQSSFENKLPGIKLSIARNIIRFSTIIYRAQKNLKAIIITLYRIYKSKSHLLEWTTSDEAERNSKVDIKSYFKEMISNVIAGMILLILGIVKNNILFLLIACFWIISPIICYFLSKEIKEQEKIKQLNNEEIKEILDIGKRTWKYFEEYLIKENNFLIPDNYQESRYKKTVNRTSSTNIGLSLISIISAYDLNYINLDKALELIKNSVETIKTLKKWNGHLYNWYNIKTLDPLKPEYISTVDSGNFVGYLILLNGFLENIENEKIKKKYNILEMKQNIEKIITETDFSKLYVENIGLFSIGFNIDENKLTDSYYDLLASEARQASIIAIAKKDVPLKHWSNLSRILTTMDRKKGLVSWSGTAFEYLMPNINIKKYKGSLLDESCKFMILSQKKYCNKLGIPWGVSEAAFNLKDLNSNYQYKAFGIPWLGLKRGLSDDIVVSGYGSILALPEEPKEVLKNIFKFKKYGAYGKYGLYESIDFTPERLGKNKKYEIVKTYMAHHQALVLLSINNLINNNILQKRFSKNPRIRSVDLLLQEKMPEDMIITKEKKEKIERIKYKFYNANYRKDITEFDDELPFLNVISNENYTVCTNKDGSGFSKYKNVLINRYKETNNYKEGIFIFFKNMKNNEIWSNIRNKENDNFITVYTQDMNEVIYKSENIKTRVKTIVSPNDNVEIRNIEIKNIGKKEEELEISSVLEPVLSTKEQDYAHKAFNNLFLKYDRIKDYILISRNKREKSKEIHLGIGLFERFKQDGNLEYELDKEELYGRLNKFVPKKILYSERFSSTIKNTVNPIVAIRKKVKIKANESINLNLIISVSEDKEETINLLEKYKSFEKVEKTFEISKIRSEETARYLQITGKEMLIYQKILSYLISLNPLKKLYINDYINKEFKIEDLWKFGISGDYPIILLKINQVSNVCVLNEILKMYIFFQNKNIQINIIVLNEEKNSYERYVKEAIEKEILDKNLIHLINKEIFVLNKNEIKDISVLLFKANLAISAKSGTLENAITEFEEEYQKIKKKDEKNNKYKLKNTEFEDYKIENLDLINKNGYGGFTKDEKEYLICVNEKVPSVWCNVLANPNFGTIVSQNLGGYSWLENCRLNRISRWSNDEIFDIPSEKIFLCDEENKTYWRIGDGKLLVTHGLGYSKYEQNATELKQELEVFVSMNKNIKINLLTLKNNTNHEKNIEIIYEIDTVLGEDEISTNGNILTRYIKEKDILYSKNLYKTCLSNISYIYSSEKILSYTGNYNSINLNKSLDLNNEDSLGNKPCMAIKISVKIKPFEKKQISLILGAERDEENFNLEYKSILKCEEEYTKTKKYWTDLLEKIKVKTPNENMNIILNGWVMYQTISSRLYAKSGFFQSGGAIGFRDQLQDAIGVKLLDSKILKNQIIEHARHQFIEGDVEHWWHKETGFGIRTRFSDDRLWLVYAVIKYINFTGDKEILDIKIPYIKGKILGEGINEDYNMHTVENIEETLLEHCIKAINISLKFGKNKLPLIGSGDWNDGFSTVGIEGKGESIWLGFFLYNILDEFIKIIDNKELIDNYNKIKEKLKKSLNAEGWDGKWYRRAYMDNGKILGSNENEECKIDSIAQSWAVISNAGEKEKQKIAMKSLEENLIDEKTEIIKLLTPAFEKSELEPGYVKAYLPGVRENGGQYTHAAIWTILAFAKLKESEKAEKYFNMINPIEHSNTKEKIEKYEIEPYVIPADIYGESNLKGKGGWSWYTGSSSWYYTCGIEYILGLNIFKNKLSLNPCIPKDWEKYSIQYKYKDSIYNIKVKNIYKNNEVKKFIFNNEEIESKEIGLVDNGKINEIEIII